MPFYRLFYHCVWATKKRQLWLTPDVEPTIHGFIRAKATGIGGKVFAVNGMEDHVHLVASIPPSVAVSTFIGQVKAVSSVKLNKMCGGGFCWQESYSVFSYGGRRLRHVVEYVDRQKEHHLQGTTIASLERVEK